MPSRLPRLNVLAWLIASLLLGVASTSTAQEVILYLRNGDRLAGHILTQTNNEIHITTSWAKDLTVPATAVDRVEAVVPANVSGAVIVQLPPSTNAFASGLLDYVEATTNVVPTKKISGDVNLGTDFLFGTSDSQNYSGGADLSYIQPYLRDSKKFFRTSLSYTVEYGRTDGVISSDRMDGTSKTDFDIWKGLYVYNLGESGYDRVRKINIMYEEGPGVGYHVLTRSNLAVNVELGSDYQRRDLSDGTSTRYFFQRYAEDLTWQISRLLTWTEKAELLSRYDNPSILRAHIESTLSYALFQNLSLNLSALDLYDSAPAVGVRHNSLELKSSVGYKF